jgi:predicted transcriptional regulator
MSAPQTAPVLERSRLSVDLSPVVSSHLDHIAEITGQSKSAIVAAALLDALPELLARADGLKRRHQELNQVKRK